MMQRENKLGNQSDGHEAEMAPAGAAVPTRPARRVRGILLSVLAVIVLAGVLFSYRYVQDQATYVSTDNALVAGAQIQVGSLNAGQVTDVAVDIGEPVAKGQVVATIALPSPVGTTASGTPKLGFVTTEDQQTAVRSPVEGVVVARQANPGDTVAAGQPLLTVVDPAGLWVKAQIEETKIGRVKLGQPVEVKLDALGIAVTGRVAAVDRATAGTFSLLPVGNASGNFNKVTQLVPVKIAIDYGDRPLVLGSSAGVKIRVDN